MSDEARTAKQGLRKVEFLDRPGLVLGDVERKRLVRDLRECAMSCFDDLPEYQCLEDRPGALDDKVITLVRSADGRVIGFSSAVILEVEGVGEVLHLGLTCVSPEARGGGFTHKLVSKIVTGYLLRHRPLGRVWTTNLACVLSSLGNVAVSFFGVHPSPARHGLPRREQMKIADAVDRRYRKTLYIDPEARFDPEAFVFRGSVRGTVFQKDADDERYFHRDLELNEFYRERMRFEDGDEVLQVGYASLPALVAYVATQRVKAILGVRERSQRSSIAAPRPVSAVETRRAA